MTPSPSSSTSVGNRLLGARIAALGETSVGIIACFRGVLGGFRGPWAHIPAKLRPLKPGVVLVGVDALGKSARRGLLLILCLCVSGSLTIKKNNNNNLFGSNGTIGLRLCLVANAHFCSS